MVQLKFATLDGKHIGYSDETVFLVQIARGRAAYRTRFAVTGNLGQAVALYRGINVDGRHVKRLIAPSFNRPVLARQRG